MMNAGQDTIPGSSITLEALREVFHLKSKDAAQALKINQRTLKNVCRRQGIDRWPQRKLSSLESLRLSIIETSGFFDEEIRKTGAAGRMIMCYEACNHHVVDDTTKKARLQKLIQLNYQMILEDPNKPVCIELEDLRCKMHKWNFANKQSQMPSSEIYDVPKKTTTASTTTAASSCKKLALCVPPSSSAAVAVSSQKATPTPFVQQLAHCGDQNYQYNLTAEHHSHHFSSGNDGCSMTRGSSLACISSSSSAVVADDFVSDASDATRSGAALTSTMTSWATMMMMTDEEEELLPSPFVNCNDEMLLAPDETVRARQQFKCCLGNFYEALKRQGSVSSLPKVMPETRVAPPSKTGPSSELEAGLLELLPSKDEEIVMSHDTGQQILMMPLHVTAAAVRAGFGTDSRQAGVRDKQDLNKRLVVDPDRPFSMIHRKETQRSCDEYHSNPPPLMSLTPATSVLSGSEQGRKTVLDLHGGASHYMHRSMAADLHGGASHYMHHSRLAAAASTVAVSDTALEGQQLLQLPSQTAVAVNKRGSNCTTFSPVTFDVWSKRRRKEDNQQTEHNHHANNWIIHEMNNLHAAFSSSSSGPPMQKQCMHGLLPQEPDRKSEIAASHNLKRHHFIMPQGAALIANQGAPSLRCHETGRIVDYPCPLILSQQGVLDCHQADCEPSPILTHPGHQPPPPHHCNQYALQEATRPAGTAIQTVFRHNRHKHIPDGIISITESEHVTSSYSSSPISSALDVGGKRRIPHLHHHNETISQYPQEQDACKEQSTTTLAAGLIGCQPLDCMSASSISDIFHTLDNDHQQYSSSLQDDGPDDLMFWAMLLD
ncbi:hypothetical protein CEUSTIGMA_g7821.t1 [Chlamydomonas eustigma]|uniref:RWP-RK domain-containing protein n=1 Tax=Chlamydomonas eustigma TaxID=1157962 RepID=A0A250XBY0_9CHLO|nr:hypothetical protein CEUSTIGMA_g7821.t1 [Chlamydomonas eustigma]|eukprot:GAX80382.1 hypothetical protein CEUSTIGMA_g7821.t1 [Chlamydomonas eustigma]